MRKLCSTILVCLCLGIAQAQTIKLDFLYNQYQAAWNQKDFTAAKRYALPWLTLYQEQQLSRDTVYAELESTLAFCYFIEYDFENAQKLYKEAFAICPKTISCNHFIQYIDTSHIDKEDKENLWFELLHIVEASHGKETIAYAKVLVHIAQFYDLQAPLLAKPFYEQAVQLLRQNNALKSHIDIALRLVQIYHDNKAISRASLLLEEITPYIPEQTSQPYIWVQWMLLRVRICIQQFNLIAAKDFLNDIVGDNTKSLPPYVNLCIQLAYADLDVADRNYSTAETKYTEIIQNIDDQVDVLSIKSYATLQLGQIYFEQDNLQAAEVLYFNLLSQQQTPALRKLTSEKLADICLEIGDYALAKKYYVEAASIVADLYGVNNAEYAKSLNNLANIAFRQRHFALAQKAYLESIAILNNLELSSMYSLTLCNLANVYIYQNKISEADICYQEALGIIEKTIGTESLEYADALNNIAIMHHIDGNYQHAYKFYTDAQQLREKITGKDGRKYLESEICLFNLYNDLDIPSMATPLLQSIVDKKSAIVQQEFWHLSERQRSEFWNETKYAFEYTYPKYIYTHSQDTALCALAYNNELFVKGLLLNTSSQIKLAINNSDNPLVQAIYSQLNSNKELLVYYQQSGKDKQTIDSITKQIDILDKQLVLHCSEYRQDIERNSIDWKTVQKNLSSNEVAIEYFSAPISADSTMYCALLLRHDSPCPELISLFEENDVAQYANKTIDGKIASNLIYSYNVEDGDTLGLGIYLSQLIWQKIMPNINKGETIYFSPSGILHQLAIEYLPYNERQRMSDIYNMVRLSSTRELAFNNRQLQYTTATVYGGIKYDLDADNLIAESKEYATRDILVSQSIKGDSLDRGSVKYLPGTKIEAESINTLLSKNNITAQLYTATKANEESFKSLSGKHNNILHIGTHGFTWTDSVARVQKYFTQHTQLTNQTQNKGYSINPLNRCGLLFAGSNIALSGHSSELPEGVQDGILTAKEISLMDLRDADLVVLSACETAKGDITSEGVFGLQRAFKMAGVQTIIMSLWKVNDQATQLLMTEFYNNWIGKHQSKREAFRNAQNTIRTQYKEPVYWSGFIMLD